MICLSKNQTRLLGLDNEYEDWYYEHVGKPPSMFDADYPLSIEMQNGEIIVKELTEEEKIKRKELSQKISEYNKGRDLWIVREAYKRYGYEVAEWMARTRRIEMPKNLYPCNGKQAQCSMFCSKYEKGCRK
jgi:hypothetical protein